MIAKYFLFLITFSISISIHGQSANSLDERFTPPKTGVFGSSNASKTDRNSGGISDLESNQFLKLSVMEIGRQQLILSYERKINSDFSLTVGLGVPIRFNFFEKTKFVNGYRVVDDIESDCEGVHYEWIYAHSSSRFGLILTGSSKKFFKFGENSYQFAELGYKFKYQNYHLSPLVDCNQSGLSTYFHYFSFLHGIGIIHSFGNAEIAHEFGWGIEIQNCKWNRCVALDENYPDRYSKIEGQNNKIITPIIKLQYHIGIGW